MVECMRTHVQKPTSKGNPVKKMFIKSILIAAALAASVSAFASSHTGIAREETKSTLVSAVEKVCEGNTAAKECPALRIVASDLYKDSRVVTRDDFARLDTIKAFLIKHAKTSETRLALKAQLDLKTAVDQAEALSLHVTFMHGGEWEKSNICLSKTA